MAEQIPHLIQAADQTETLAWGYWPSYNVPYFPEVTCRADAPSTPVHVFGARRDV